VAASAGNTIDPIHQFQVNKIVPINLFGQDVSFSNASLFMTIVVLSILGLMVYGTRKQASHGKGQMRGDVLP
jgi:F-type H+-transporting ATPase subunit a